MFKRLGYHSLKNNLRILLDHCTFYVGTNPLAKIISNVLLLGTFYLNNCWKIKHKHLHFTTTKVSQKQIQLKVGGLHSGEYIRCTDCCFFSCLYYKTICKLNFSVIKATLCRITKNQSFHLTTIFTTNHTTITHYYPHNHSCNHALHHPTSIIFLFHVC